MKRDIPNRPLCPECGVNLRPIKRYKQDGEPYYYKHCMSCSYKLTGKEHYVKRSKSIDKRYKEAKERKRKNMTCEMCGFRALDECQLDIDHIDGNHDNNTSSNHQILCANCHRLKTKVNKDGVYGKTTGNKEVKLRYKWTITNESGEEVNTNSLNSFCKEYDITYHSLYYHFKNNKPYKGWSVIFNEF